MRPVGILLAATVWVGPASSVFAADAAPAVPVVQGEFAPFDTCAKLPGAAAFRARLVQAVKARNVAALVSLTTPQVKLDFGGGEGQDELRRRLTSAEGAQLWRELDRILPLGCAGDEESMRMPSLFAQDLGDADPFEVMLATGDRVPLLAGPSAKAEPVRLLSWVLVEPVSGDDYEAPFRRVRVRGSEIEGYVANARLRSPIDYRLGVVRQDGTWKIDLFVAGD